MIGIRETSAYHSTPMKQESAILKVIDDLWTQELQQKAWEAVSAKRWYFGNSSVGGGEPGFWKMDLKDDPRIDALWEAAKERCEAVCGKKLAVVRQYANGHTYGLGGRTHVDDKRPGYFTLLCYPMAEWKPAWGGETVYETGTGEIARSIMPKPGRAVFFDSRIPHSGRAPSRDFGGLRVTIAFKLGPAAA
jgi:hypothetical protein